MTASTDFNERKNVVNLWDDVVYKINRRQEYSDSDITATMVQASNESATVDISGLPSIKADDLSYQAVKDWLAMDVTMTLMDKITIRGGKQWLEGWIADSQNR